MKQFRAIRALRLNYRWSGVYRWLRAPWCSRCRSHGIVIGPSGRPIFCPACDGKPRPGYKHLCSEPGRVIQEQQAIAEGVFA